jgi:hypothetical protein
VPFLSTATTFIVLQLENLSSTLEEPEPSNMTTLNHNAPTLVELAEDILRKAKKLQSAIPKSPTFFDDTLSGLSPQDDADRKALIDATETLNALARGANGFGFGRISRIILAVCAITVLKLNSFFNLHINSPTMR